MPCADALRYIAQPPCVRLFSHFRRARRLSAYYQHASMLYLVNIYRAMCVCFVALYYVSLVSALLALAITNYRLQFFFCALYLTKKLYIYIYNILYI